MRAQHYSAKRAQLRAAWRLEGEPADVDVASARAGRSLTSGCGVKRVSRAPLATLILCTERLTAEYVYYHTGVQAR